MGYDIVAQADVTGVTVLATVTVEASVAVVCKDDRNHRLARLHHFLRIRLDLHTVLHNRRAAQAQAGRALDVDETATAACVGLQSIDVAEVRNVEAVVLEHLDERGAVRCFHLLAVDRNSCHLVT